MLTMRLLLFLLLFWIAEAQIEVNEISGKITCNGEDKSFPYKDTSDEIDCGQEKIFVKIRTCDNCIELDVGASVGLAVANLVFTALIGAAVYLVASGGQTPPRTADSQVSDRQQLIPGNTRARGSNAIYQDLHTRNPKDEYDVLAARR